MLMRVPLSSGGDSPSMCRAGDPERHPFFLPGGNLPDRRPNRKYHRSSHSFPNQTHVKHGDIDAIATSAGAIVRTADGKIIMQDLPAPIAPPLVVGNEVYLMCGSGQSNGHGSRMKITLDRQGDEIVGTINWAYLSDNKNLKAWIEAAKAYAPDLTLGELGKKDPVSNIGPLLLDGLVFVGSGAYDAATGAIKKDVRESRAPSGHLIHTGNDRIYTTTLHRDTYVYDAKKLGKPQSHPLGSEWHRQLQLGAITLDEAKQALLELPWLPHVGKHFGGQTTPWPQGDRIYFRTHDTLYCIGDPTAPYRSPASAPAAARTDR
jgi:hypothetical protein